VISRPGEGNTRTTGGYEQGSENKEESHGEGFHTTEDHVVIENKRVGKVRSIGWREFYLAAVKGSPGAAARRAVELLKGPVPRG
jgi:hypothetical protein